ncbi:MAG: glycerol-3-phosphate 1-O-acyltransferase PlsY [Tissierellia bacterium]|nr:glycerol-3-phosphate 1-O-acyltransferase PlsY [Tissierellia bacterium]
MMDLFMIAAMAYLFGNFSSAYILGRLFRKEDIRNFGSGNAGATNALRVFGKRIGIISLISDILKGVLAVYIAGYIWGEQAELLAGIFVVIGHNWPALLGFKGGKGIATSLGVIAWLHWPTIVISITIAVLIIARTRYVSLGSIVGAVLTPIIGALINRPFDKNFILTISILSAIAIYQHRDNFGRLIRGEELRLGEKIDEG